MVQLLTLLFSYRMVKSWIYVSFFQTLKYFTSLLYALFDKKSYPTIHLFVMTWILGRPGALLKMCYFGAEYMRSLPFTVRMKRQQHSENSAMTSWRVQDWRTKMLGRYEYIFYYIYFLLLTYVWPICTAWLPRIVSILIFYKSSHISFCGHFCDCC